MILSEIIIEEGKREASKREKVNISRIKSVFQ